MRILSLLILFTVLFLSNQKTDSPHGSEFKISCKICHSTKGWQLDKDIYSFDHNKTRLPLVGQHTVVNCRLCHTTLVFSEAKNECSQCHIDVHQSTVGLDCSRCHTPASWLVNNIAEIHRASRFPLLGAHRTADCSDCHRSETLVRFDVPGVECIDCHRDDYLATTNPNHVQSGMSEDCSICHSINAFQWSGGRFNHNFFALTQGHSAVKCTECHTSGTFTGLNPDCYSCHQNDFVATTSPNHATSNFPTTCSNCHTLTPGWKPAAFDHSGFPLTQGHSAPNCIDCHTSGNYTPLSTDCYACHQQDFVTSTNPNHSSAGFPTTCTQCHTTDPGWKPATFNHNSFPLTLGHASPTCTDCHKNGNYTTTPTDCYSCHLTDYNNTTNPNHRTLAFATVCSQCHNTNPGWKPASYTQHDSQFFPIYSGKHQGQWDQCTDCHTDQANYALFNCKTCHSNVHTGNNYTNAQCYSCHPTGTGD